MEVGERAYLDGGFAGQVVWTDGEHVTLALDGGGEITVAVKPHDRQVVHSVRADFQTRDVGCTALS